MRSIAIINQKGGVGKTTSATNLATALAMRGQRVLAVDLDPQAHLTVHFGVESRVEGSGSYSVLADSSPIGNEILKVRKNLWLLPSHLDLAAAEVELISVVGREVILRDALRDVAEDFDFIFIDCPPSLGILTINALVAVTEVFIPLQPHFLALQGVGMLMDETIRLVARRINPRLRVTGIILTMFEGTTRLANEVVDDVKGFLEASRGTDCPWSQAVVFDSPIRRNVKLAEAPSHGLTIFDYAPRSNGALDYARLAAEVLGETQAAADTAGGTPDDSKSAASLTLGSQVPAEPTDPPDVANIA